ncbi:MAG: ABC transporter substrate-binding protein [Deltaproteobacteria bacterium]|nr:ABC transporter substrate-binding protein [Deltaproteobacteria bacterium]MBI2539853.1 ABC transporter substrate-binding protein [Deltaproteobacteria bacterium]MBI2991484.1 ABC transporter substrate-binding protein [Deltaproteobacteria bacterium]MBI3062954.1 ABC transporter substrate-binding protein [Deltaproteobacteria bacterium]
MKQKPNSTVAPLLLLFFALVAPSPSSAGAPTEQIRASVDKIVAILNNPQLKSAAKTKERRDQLRQAISSRFDFTEMARRSLGSQWRRLGPKEQEEFVRLFTDLLERAYVDRIEGYSDEKFAYVREILDRNYAEVNSRIVTHNGEEFSLNYKVLLKNGEWKVYDVVVENISLVNNYRSQFTRIIANSSYEELVRRMKDKQIEVARERK